ncbi:hypothetical protein Emag_004368 [Eimeria magna]
MRLQDFLLISFVCFTYGIALPFIAADEAFGAISVVHRVLRRCGAFFVCRGGQQQGREETAETNLLGNIRSSLLKEYVKCIARRYGVFELFLEGGRSKTGLLLPPKRGILTTVLEMVLRGPSLDVTLVPISVSYDKILEAETFPQELLGEPKKAEALSRVLKATRLLADRSYQQKLMAGPGSRGLSPQFGPGYRPCGTATINVMEPISFREYLFNTWGNEASLKTLLGALRHSAASPMTGFEEMPKITGQPRIILSTDQHKPENVMPEEQRQQLATSTTSYGVMRAGGQLPPIPDDIRKKVIVDISDRVMEKLSEGLYITPTSLVATILALHRDGIREEDLIAQVAWLRDEVLARGGKLSPCVGGFSYAPFACVRTVLGRYLNSVVEQKGEGWTAASSYTGDASDAQGAPLRAHLPRLLACGGPAAWKDGVTLEDLQSHTTFLLRLLGNHFVYSGKMTEDAVENVVSLMEQRGLLQRHEKGAGSDIRFAFNQQQEAMVVLLCCFIWPFLHLLLLIAAVAVVVFASSLRAAKPLACASPQLRKRQLVARAHWLADGLCKQRILGLVDKIFKYRRAAAFDASRPDAQPATLGEDAPTGSSSNNSSGSSNSSSSNSSSKSSSSGSSARGLL